MMTDASVENMQSEDYVDLDSLVRILSPSAVLRT